jgi:hypothetical protein
MKPAPETREILIIQNITREGSGLLGEIIADTGIRSKVIDLSLGEKLPPPERLAAVVVLGGPDSANDTSPGMLNELILSVRSSHPIFLTLGSASDCKRLLKQQEEKLSEALQRKLDSAIRTDSFSEFLLPKTAAKIRYSME